MIAFPWKQLTSCWPNTEMMSRLLAFFSCSWNGSDLPVQNGSVQHCTWAFSQWHLHWYSCRLKPDTALLALESNLKRKARLQDWWNCFFLDVVSCKTNDFCTKDLLLIHWRQWSCHCESQGIFYISRRVIRSLGSSAVCLKYVGRIHSICKCQNGESSCWSSKSLLGESAFCLGAGPHLT